MPTKIISFFAALMGLFPERYTNALFVFVLQFFPVWVIRAIPWSYSAYLRCYQPRTGDVILDCGAHIGNCSLLFSRLVGEKGLVVALEPHMASYNVLKERIEKRRRSNILILKKGVWNQTGTYSLSVFENTIACKIDEGCKNPGNGQHEYIDCITIDELTRELGLKRLDMIKMDIEGAEIEALEGAVWAIETFQPKFGIASYHKRGGRQTFEMVEKMLSSKGYSAVTFFTPHLTTCGKYRYY